MPRDISNAQQSCPGNGSHHLPQLIISSGVKINSPGAAMNGI
jgi:hypothetical protein